MWCLCPAYMYACAMQGLRGAKLVGMKLVAHLLAAWVQAPLAFDTRLPAQGKAAPATHQLPGRSGCHTVDHVAAGNRSAAISVNLCSLSTPTQPQNARVIGLSSSFGLAHHPGWMAAACNSHADVCNWQNMPKTIATTGAALSNELCARACEQTKSMATWARQAAKETAAGPPKLPAGVAPAAAGAPRRWLVCWSVGFSSSSQPCLCTVATPQMLDWMRWAMADSDSPEKVSPTCGCSSTAGNSRGRATNVSVGACAEETYTKALEQAETTKELGVGCGGAHALECLWAWRLGLQHSGSHHCRDHHCQQDPTCRKEAAVCAV